MDETSLGRILALVKERAKLEFKQSSMDHVEAECRYRIAAHGGDVDAYIKTLEKTPVGSGEWNELIDVLTVHETSFFRHKGSYDYLTASVLSRVGVGQSVRIWCIGCSTGEEVYSIAMQAEAERRKAGKVWDFHVVGTDVSAKCIAVSVEGHYPREKAARIPADYRSEFLVENDGTIRVLPEIKNKTRFLQHNVLRGFSVLAGGLDVIWCQNMLIYYERAQRDELLNGMAARLRYGGLLLLAPGEAIGWRSSEVIPVVEQHMAHAFRKIN